MANFAKNAKIYISIAFICAGLFFASFNFCFANENQIQKENQKYEEIYRNLPEPDFSYIFNLDPYQSEEYTKYMYAPYPLFRTAIRFVFKNTVIEPGYYLLTPREKTDIGMCFLKQTARCSILSRCMKKTLLSRLSIKDMYPSANLHSGRIYARKQETPWADFLKNKPRERLRPSHT